MQLKMLNIRQATEDDLGALRDIATAMKAAKDIDYFEMALEQQASGTRLVLLGECDCEMVAYCMLAWAPKYGFYKATGTPEIQDLNVLPDYRQRGIATAMIEKCENIVRAKGVEQIGISVGLSTSFGAAQRLYFKLGYMPDGHGVTYDRKTVAFGEFRPVDNDLCLMLVKDLQS